MQLEKVSCTHWREGACLKGYYGGRPSVGTCKLMCPEYKMQNPESPDRSQSPKVVTEPLEVRPYRWYHKHRGLGDTVKWAIKVVSFGLIKQKKDCGCKNRQNWLNRKFPYPWRARAEQARKLDD